MTKMYAIFVCPHFFKSSSQFKASNDDLGWASIQYHKIVCVTTGICKQMPLSLLQYLIERKDFVAGEKLKMLTSCLVKVLQLNRDLQSQNYSLKQVGLIMNYRLSSYSWNRKCI